MNKVKMFFVAAALVLTTAGVFAGKSKFLAPIPSLYFYNTSTGAYNVEHSTTLSGSFLKYDPSLSFSPATATYGGNTYSIYTTPDAGTHWYPVYF